MSGMTKAHRLWARVAQLLTTVPFLSRLEVHLVGGFSDDRQLSRKLTHQLLSKFTVFSSKFDKHLDPLQVHLRDTHMGRCQEVGAQGLPSYKVEEHRAGQSARSLWAQ